MNPHGNDPIHYDHLESIRGDISFDGATTFSTLQTAFSKALVSNRENSREFFFTFAGQRVHVHIVGRELAAHITSAFSHLQTDSIVPGTAQLTIELWDECATGVRCQVRFPNDQLRGTDVIATSVDQRFLVQQQPKTFACLDRITSHIIGAIDWSKPIGVYEQAKPLSKVLLEWHNDHHIQIIHAGLIARRSQGILFVGKSGAGKSTSTLACVCGGFSSLSEDYVGLQRGADGAFHGHSLYNSVFLNQYQLQQFPGLTPYVIKGRPDEKKAAVFLAHIFPTQLERVVPIRALLIPRIVHTPASQLSPASKGQALLALGPSSLLQISNPRGGRSFQTLAQLVEQVPCYWLDTGYDLTSIPRCIEEFFAERILLWKQI